MTDDLVKRLREGDEFERFMLAERAADRIEELEAKLAKAEYVVLILASAEWDDRLGEAVDLACAYLAEVGEEQ